MQDYELLHGVISFCWNPLNYIRTLSTDSAILIWIFGSKAHLAFYLKPIWPAIQLITSVHLKFRQHFYVMSRSGVVYLSVPSNVDVINRRPNGLSKISISNDSWHSLMASNTARHHVHVGSQLDGWCESEFLTKSFSWPDSKHSLS